MDSSENSDKKNLKNLLNNGSQGVPLSFGFDFGKDLNAKNGGKKCAMQIRHQFDEKKILFVGTPGTPPKIVFKIKVLASDLVHIDAHMSASWLTQRLLLK